MKTYAAIKGYHQYYRDILSQAYAFPEIGKFPIDIMSWVFAGKNTDTLKLAELLLRAGPSDLPPERDMALKLMLLTIVQGNLLLDGHNGGRQAKPLPLLAESLKSGLKRIIELDDDASYKINAMQILYRLGQAEEFMAMAAANPGLVEKTPILRSIMAMIAMSEGEYRQALEYISPLENDPAQKNQPLVLLTAMACRFLLGELPEQPVRFASLRENDAERERHLKTLLPLTWHYKTPLPADRPVLFSAADPGYFFEHMLPLAYSVYETNRENLSLHLHLYSPDESVLREIENLQKRLPELAIAVTMEKIELPEAQALVAYTASRFIAAYQLLEHYPQPLLMIDADALLRRDWREWSAVLPVTTEIVVACPEYAPLWEQVIAGCIYAKPGQLSKNYLGMVARFIQDNYMAGNYTWFLDQIALSACRHAHFQDAPGFASLSPSEIIDMNHGASALAWGVTTRKDAPGEYNDYKAALCMRYGDS